MAIIWVWESVLVEDAKIKSIKGIKVPIIGITLETWPIFKAINIKYAPIVQKMVEAEAIKNISKAGTLVKGKAKIARTDTRLM